jgi:hypothetical protein
MQVQIEVTSSDPKGKEGGTQYTLTQKISDLNLTTMIAMSDDQLREALYPADTIAYIRSQLVVGNW